MTASAADAPAPRVISTIAELREAIAALRAEGSIAFVPTMGALHEGHLNLVRRARKLGDAVVVSIFVNPLQFGAGEDLDRYPRTLDEDLDRLGPERVALVFAPTPAEMYPEGALATKVSAGALGGIYEGKIRPGHFDGVLTVVAKLLNLVQPDAVVFGRKDAQQLALVRRMVRELSFPVRIEALDTVREPDNLAMSSRNRYLSPAERAAATRLSKALEAALDSAGGGVDAAVVAAQSVLSGEPLITLDYLAAVHPDTFALVPDGFRGEALMIIAATVGSTRLIDNEPIFFA